MVTSLAQQPTSQKPPRNQGTKALAPDFRLLGLRPREARLEVIRQAAKQAAGDAKTNEGSEGDDAERVAQVATAAYRLMDPRKRRSLFERVQLLLWTEDDLDLVAEPLWSHPQQSQLADLPSKKNVNRVVARPVGNQSAPPVVAKKRSYASRSSSRRVASSSKEPTLSDRQAEETAVALETFRQLRRNHRQAMTLWVTLVALALSLTCSLALIAFALL